MDSKKILVELPNEIVDRIEKGKGYYVLMKALGGTTSRQRYPRRFMSGAGPGGWRGKERGVTIGTMTMVHRVLSEKRGKSTIPYTYPLLGRAFPPRSYFPVLNKEAPMKQTVFEVTQSFRSTSEEVRQKLIQEKIERYLKRRIGNA